MHHEPLHFQVLCPRAHCRRPIVVGKDGLARCPRCETELGAWRKPAKSWPPKIRTKRLRPLLPAPWGLAAAAATVTLAILVPAWIVSSQAGDPADAPHTLETASTEPRLALETLRAFLRDGRVPASLDLPDYYQDLGLIAERGHQAFTAASPLIKSWMTLTTREQHEILMHVEWDGSPLWLSAFLAEVAYYVTPLETNEDTARLIRSSVVTTGNQVGPLARFLLQHIAATCRFDTVRSLARDDANTLDRRIHALGR